MVCWLPQVFVQAFVEGRALAFVQAADQASEQVAARSSAQVFVGIWFPLLLFPALIGLRLWCF